MKIDRKKPAKPEKIRDLKKVADQKSENVRGGALNAYVSKLQGEKQGGSR